MDELNVEIGDNVIRNYGSKFSVEIGTVVNITPKRRDIVVDYGNYKETFDKFGYSRGDTIWTASKIRLLTPEIIEDLKRISLIQKCRDTFIEKQNNLTFSQAEKILKILNEDKI